MRSSTPARANAIQGERMWRLTALFVAVLMLVGGLSAAPAWAACEGPTITVDPATARPGDQVTVTGTGWGRCADGTIPGQDLLGTAVQQIEITLTQGTERWRLDTVDANSLLRFQTVVTIPDDVAARTSTIEAQEPSVGLAAARFTVEGPTMSGAGGPSASESPTAGAGGAASPTASPTASPSSSGSETASEETPVASDQLPRTGSPVGWLLATALAAMIAGAGVLTADRRRRAG